MEWWGWLSAGLGGVILLSNGVKAIKELLTPAAKASAKLSEIESRCNLREERLSELEQSTRVMMGAMFAIVNHEIDGNGIDGLKKSRDELQKYVINK